MLIVMTFEEIPVGHLFKYNGRFYRKHSTRTAHIEGSRRTWYYFRHATPCIVADNWQI